LLQEDITDANKLWIGNPFVADDPAVKLALVVDGQAPGKPPLLEIHNPTDQPITTRIVSPPHTPLFGGISTSVGIPAGDSTWLQIVDGRFRPRSAEIAADAKP
jgi:hypothetical protein